MENMQINDLSDRELDILKLVATGASNKEIAQKLFISSNTVKVHLRNIFTKINATSRTEAAMYAVRIGLVENASPQKLVRDGGVKSTESVELSKPGETIFPGKNVQSKDTKIRRFTQYVGFSVVIIALIIFTTIYIRNNLIPANTSIPPTSTPRVQWFESTGLPIARQGVAAVSYENMIYAIGGDTGPEVSDIVGKYDPKTDTWTNLLPKPTPVTDIKAVIVGGLIYVPGGRQSSGAPTSTIEIYDPEMNQWSTGSSLPKALSAFSLVVYEGKMYIFGGWDGSQATNSVYIFDPHDNTWSEGTPMPTARSSSGATVIGGKIYIIGGWDGNRSLSACEVFRPDIKGEDREWTTCPSLPYGRIGMGVTALADMIFVLGGSDQVEDPATIVLLQGASEWSKLDSPISNRWSNLSIVVIGSRLYAFGGVSQGALTNQMWSYQAIYTITLPIVR